MMSLKGLVACTVAATMVSAVAVLPADARAKKQKRYRVETTTTPSLDGRITGRARTCWHETFVYDSRGVPTGPYCH
jgi:hypothetical protein